MTTAYQLFQQLQAVDPVAVAEDILASHGDELAELNRKQLLKGKDNTGRSLLRYEDDPWFKSKEAARRYAGWKKRLYPETPFGVANFTITGVYHRSISVKRIGDSLEYAASVSFAASIDNKTNNAALGLNPDSRATALEEILAEPFMTTMAERTGLTTK